MTDIQDAWQRIDAWLMTNAPETAQSLRPGATAEQIAQAEQELGVTFPDDVRASYRIHDGQGMDKTRGIVLGGWFTEGGEFLSLDGMLLQWRLWKGLLDEGAFEDDAGEPSPEVKADWWNAKWIPITHDGSGNHFCLDLDPAPKGKAGQIITLWHDDETRDVLAGSLTDWLTQLADEYDRGEWMYSEEDGTLVRV